MIHLHYFDPNMFVLNFRNGSNTQGYFVWSLVDCFEFLSGYTGQYGLYGVDFSKEERPRYQRNSARWYANVLGAQTIRNRARRDGAFGDGYIISS